MKGTRTLVLWQQAIRPGELAGLARAAGFGHRHRILTPIRLFWALTLGFEVGSRRSLAGLSRFFSFLSGRHHSRQAFHKRMGNEAAAFMRGCFLRLMGRCSEWMREDLPGALESFQDICILDSTTLRLADRLARRFPACRHNSRKSALKLHACMSLTQKQVQKLQVSGERMHDRKGVAIGAWVKDRLLTFDLGYFDYGLMGQILAWGGGFCCRPCVDLDVEFGQGSRRQVFRVVGLWDAAWKDYHWYLTSLAPEEFTPEQIGRLYGLRWQIELLFKEWKSLCRLKDLPSRKESVVMCLIYASLCASILSRLLLWMACRRCGLSWNMASPMLAVRVMGFYAAELGHTLLAHGKQGLADLLTIILKSLAVHATLPNKTNAVLDFQNG
jgi:putative transposase